jgi:hypothetical protein
MNKLSLVGMQLPVKYKENFDVSSEGPSSGVLRWKPRKSTYIFQEVASLPTKACSYYWHYTGTYSTRLYHKMVDNVFFQTYLKLPSSFSCWKTSLMMGAIRILLNKVPTTK